MRVVPLLLALTLIPFADAQTRKPAPTQKAAPRQQTPDAPAPSPFSNEGRVVQDALPQPESLRGVVSATVKVTANDVAKQYMSVKEASDIVAANLFTGKFKAIAGEADPMPLLLFDISVSEPPASGLMEAAKAIIIRMQFVQALPKRPSDTGTKVLVVTTFDDAYSGYGRNNATIHRLMQEGLTGLSKEFATAFDTVH
jgi:hypothetical protein